MTSVETEARKDRVMLAVGGSLVELDTFEAFELVTQLLAAIDTARGYNANERGTRGSSGHT